MLLTSICETNPPVVNASQALIHHSNIMQECCLPTNFISFTHTKHAPICMCKKKQRKTSKIMMLKELKHDIFFSVLFFQTVPSGHIRYVLGPFHILANFHRVIGLFLYRRHIYRTFQIPVHF